MDIQNLLSLLVKELSGFSDSGFFLAIKIFLGIYILVLFLDIAILLLKRGVSGNITEMISGTDLPPELTSRKKKLRASWKKIRARLESVNESEYKVAIIEADAIVEDLLKKMGYAGDHLSEKLSGIPEGQLEHLEDVREAHEVRNRIIHEDDFALSREAAQDLLKKYEKFLDHFEIFS